MRNFIDIAGLLTESLSRWNDETDEDPPYGAGEELSKDQIPTILYHGTNPIAAAAILNSGLIEAEYPVDEDGLGQVVCVTSSEEMGRNFATEFVRFNSEYEVGVVFEINGSQISDPVIPFHAETAGIFEYEFRVKGNIPLSICRWKIVGDRDLLVSANFLKQLWNDVSESHLRNEFSDRKQFYALIKKLIK